MECLCLRSVDEGARKRCKGHPSSRMLLQTLSHYKYINGHPLWQVGRYIFRRSCGCHAEKSLQKLQAECVRKPRHASYKSVRRRLASGIEPHGKRSVARYIGEPKRVTLQMWEELRGISNFEKLQADAHTAVGCGKLAAALDERRPPDAARETD